MIKNIVFLGVILFNFSASALQTQVLQSSTDLNSDTWSAEAIYKFESMGFPQNLPKSLLTVVLQSFYDQKKDKAFRVLGDNRDFNHGHLVMSDEGLRALLLHTQERASIAPAWSRFATVDREGRNWLVFLNAPTEFHNAFEFRYSTKPSFWGGDFERNVTWEQYEEARTVTELMLDPIKIGFHPIGFLNSEKGEQIYFQKASCPAINENLLEKSNLIRLKTSAGFECLYINSMACVFKSHFKCPGKGI